MAVYNDLIYTWMDLVDSMLGKSDIEKRNFFELYISSIKREHIRSPPHQLELLAYNRHMLELVEKRNAEGKKFKGSIIGYNTIMYLLNTYNKQDTIPPVKMIPLLTINPMKFLHLEFCVLCHKQIE